MLDGVFEQEIAGKKQAGEEGSGGGRRVSTGLCCIYVRACCTRGARSRRSCGWWGRRGRWERGGVGNCSSGMDGSETIMR